MTTQELEEPIDKALDNLIEWILGHDEDELGNINFRKAKREVLIVHEQELTKARLEEENRIKMLVARPILDIDERIKTLTTQLKEEE